MNSQCIIFNINLSTYTITLLLYANIIITILFCINILYYILYYQYSAVCFSCNMNLTRWLTMSANTYDKLLFYYLYQFYFGRYTIELGLGRRGLFCRDTFTSFSLVFRYFYTTYLTENNIVRNTYKRKITNLKRLTK